MIYTEFQGEQLSMLGFGTMRLPTCPDGSVDEARTAQMVDYALSHGVNYFDTAYPYHDGQSEIAVGKALSKHPRESWKLATKYPGHQLADTYYPAEIFEKQLQKCGVEYFDYYLLHNVYAKSMEVYLDPKWGIIDYFKEQKRLGRIRHLGFSCHGSVDMMEKFLAACGEDMEFCQIQLNYLDWTLQDAKEKCALLGRHNIPIWVMEPVRGGKLAKIPGEQALHALRPDESTAAWAFRFLQDIPGVTVILSGMSDLAQMEENIETFAQKKPLNETEKNTLLTLAEGMKASVPCTGCRYCCAGCPQGIEIPVLLQAYNEYQVDKMITITMAVESLPEDKRAKDCIACGACVRSCPQNINVPEYLKKLAQIMKDVPTWETICRQRAEAQP